MKEKYNRIIIGAGLSGLIAKHFYPDALLISKDIGGVIQNNILFRLHMNEACAKFLTTLNIPYDIKLCLVGYFYDGELHDYADREKKIEYYQKSRMRRFPPEGDLNSFLSQGKGLFDYLDFNVGEMIERLADAAENSGTMCSEFVNEFHPANNFIITESGKEIHYNEMICTIPAIEFCRRTKGLEDFVSDFKYTPKITQWVQYDYYELFSGCDFYYDYVYFLDKENPLLRISDEKHGFIHEYKPSAIVCKNFEKIRYGNLLSLPDRKIWAFWSNIYFVGRYANWNQSILISDVIRSLALKKLAETIRIGC